MGNLLTIVAFAARHNGDAKQTADAIRRALADQAYASLRATLPESIRQLFSFQPAGRARRTQEIHMSTDVILTPATDGTYAIASRGTTPEANARLRRAGLGHFLGFDPKSAADRAEVERRIAEHAGADLTVSWAS